MPRLPSLFVSHGAPTFALEPGLVGPRLTALGRALPRPDAALVVSPHWMTPAPCVSATAQPATLHDFFRGGHGQDEAYVAAFAAWVREAVVQGDGERLRRALDDAPEAGRAHPTPEHFWPLLVAAGAAEPGSPVQAIEGGIAHGMLAMDAYLFGGGGGEPGGAAA